MSNENKGLWFEIQKDIELKIINGIYKAGDKIPTLVELTEQYNIGRITAHKALNALYDDGIIVKRVAAGCFVKPFVREKLIEKHKGILREKLTGLVREAENVGVDRAQLIELILEIE